MDKMLKFYVKVFIIRRLCYSVDNVVSQNSYDHMCSNTLKHTHNVIDNVHVNNMFFY